MRKVALVAAVSMALMAGCTGDEATTSTQARSNKGAQNAAGTVSAFANAAAPQRRAGESFANAPDRGTLIAYADAAPVQKGAYTWREVQMSEAHALRAIATGTMEIPAPDGTPIRVKYVGRQEHDNGDWTFVGRLDGAKPGKEALITFGKDAVFATIPNPKGGEDLQLTTVGGRGFLIETDPKLVKMPTGGDADFMAPPMAAAAAMLPMPKSAQAAGMARMPGAQGLVAQKASTVGTTVDLVVGYTAEFATRLGGQSQAQTRISFIVDLANQAFTNSEVDGRLRVVNVMQVGYTETNTNRAALLELTGLACTTNNTGSDFPDGGVTNCTTAAIPAALQPLVASRDAYGADLVTLVRTFQDPEQGSCGLGWMIGGGQSTFDQADAPFGYSIISDTSGPTFPDPDTNTTCRNETLGHETGHNFGLQHDVDTADRTDNVLQPNEFGHFPYSFGFVATVPRGQLLRRHGHPSHGPEQLQRVLQPEHHLLWRLPVRPGERGRQRARAAADDPDRRALPRGDGADQRHVGARRLQRRRQGRRVVAQSRNGIERRVEVGQFNTCNNLRGLGDQNWQAIGSADFNGDHADDVVWRHAVTGQTVIWRSGNADTASTIGTPAGYRVVGAGDFDGDGSDDLLWRNEGNGLNVYWRSANPAFGKSLTPLGGRYWNVVGVGDFNHDGKADILWRNFDTART